MGIKSLILLAVITPALLWFSMASALAQQNGPSLLKIPSDLALDLQFAQKNPAPESEIINQAESKKAVILTPTTQQTVKLEENLANELKTQAAEETNHPDQSTSEQVVITPNSGDSSTSPANPSEQILPNSSSVATPNGTEPQPSNNSNKIPGTNITEPDDNAAPSVIPEPNSPVNDGQVPANDQPPADPNQILPDDNSAAVQGASTKANWVQKLIYLIFKK